jgi:hypothetical protein
MVRNIKIVKWIWYILISAGMKFNNKTKFRYGIPAYTVPIRALRTTHNDFRTSFGANHSINCPSTTVDKTV